MNGWTLQAAARHILPGVLAISLAAAVLLLTDLPTAAEKDPAAQRTFRIGMLQMVSQPIIEDGAAGVLAGLAEAGYAEGRELQVIRFNAEGDAATVTTMAQGLSDKSYDLVVTLTTLACQAMAKANQKGTVPHVFGLVSDPTVAGVGIGKEPLDHPPHMVGVGTLPPVDASIEMARRLYPRLKRLGLVWNPAESNSVVSTGMARETCKRLQIELLEANCENTAAVGEATASLIDRVDALWVGGDVTVLPAIDVVIRAAKKARIPVCTCIPGNAAKGTLFDLGANYYEVGRSTGKMAARILDGENVAKIAWEKSIPPKFFVNATVLADLKDPWVIPQEIRDQADALIDEKGLHEKSPRAAPPAAASPRKTWRVRLLSYINSPDTEDSERGVLEGLKSSGLVAGRDFEWKSLNAQGDITSLNGLVDAAVTDRADLLVTISTQALQSASKRAHNTPVVFTMVADPFAAGVGKTDADHLPHLTGAHGAGDHAGMMPIIRRVLPGAKRLGALYSPTELNSVQNHKLLQEAAGKAGYELVSVGVNTPSEVPDATQSLCDRDLDAMCLPNSNLAGSTFPSIIQTAKRAKLPVFGFLGSMSAQGAVAVLSRDYYDMGRDAGQLAARVIRGESPARIPFKPATTTRLLINQDAARACGLTIPEDILKRAAKVIP